jgi:serine/threonine protein kinase
LSEDGIFHRDISTGNLMLRRLPGPEGKIQGVLSDFDLAVDLHDPDMKEVSHLHRTGTLPFLSMSLLTQLENPEVRFSYLLRFDLESCIYVFIWDAMYHPEGGNTPKSQLAQTNELLDTWLSSDPTALYRSKSDLSRNLTSQYLPEDGEARGSFPHLFRCRMPLKELLSSLSIGYSVWDLQATKRGLDASSADWNDLCGFFSCRSVLEQFKAMQTALTEPA